MSLRQKLNTNLILVINRKSHNIEKLQTKGARRRTWDSRASQATARNATALGALEWTKCSCSIIPRIALNKRRGEEDPANKIMFSTPRSGNTVEQYGGSLRDAIDAESERAQTL